MNRFTIGALPLLIAAMTAAGTPGHAQSSVPADGGAIISGVEQSDTADVEHVMDAFHKAVVTHDGPRLARLFLPQGGIWLNVLSDRAYALAKEKSPEVTKVRIGSYADFARLVSTSSAAFNPQHTHIQLNSDGTIASVYFDFVFLIDGKEQNRGSETWQLIKGSDGWRIAAVTYSSNPPLPAKQ
jgi:hypothetical protein